MPRLNLQTHVTHMVWDDHVVNHPNDSQVEGVYGIIYEVREVCSIFTILE